jgi:NADPH:quinone reductase-like Zn-dependent oxidoreductase
MSDEAWQTAHSENQCRDFKIRGETNSGVFIEEFVISERYLAQAPEHLNLSQLACVPLAYLTAWQMITEKAEIFPGRFDCRQLGSILVHGAGSGVTQALLEILLSMKIPPNQIFVSSRDLLKLDGWKARGLKTVLANDSFEQALKSAAPKKFSFIFDHVGSKFFELNVKCLVDGGRLISCGATSGFQAQLDLRHLFFRQLQLIGSTMGSLRHFQEVVRWISQRKIVPGVSQEWHWSEAAAAYLHLESGTQNGKIILRAM